ncbi:MAG: carbohydrate binding family 9 domain-containing protein [Acidobacteria bacterium]|nr:carbohydrate binding family 9 domain-containing protein [Acidobacteriota bacterium]
MTKCPWIRWWVSLLLLTPVLAQEETGTAAGTIAAVSLETQLKLDGKLNEPEWQLATPANGFVQAEPYQGTPASENTDVRVLFDREHLYVGVLCYDRNAQDPIINTRRRDFDDRDNDTFSVVLSPFNDNRTGYIFSTTPEGAQRDAQVTQDGVQVNLQWDGVWYVKTARVEQGWSIEMAIPFKTLRFFRHNGTWTINFSRQMRRKNEVSYWSLVPRRYSLGRISSAGKLEGLSEIPRGRNLLVKPFFLSDVSRIASRPGERRFSPDGGIDVKYGLSSQLALDLTLNTDFSQVEVDQQQVNLTRFPLFFPEKRDFFLENAGVFHFGVRPDERRGGPDAEDVLLFFSRRIGLSPSGEPIPILGGARLTGRVDRFNFGFLSVQTRSEGPTPANNFSVARVKMDVFSNSDVGAILVNRSARSNDHSRALGVDTNFKFRNDLRFTTFLARTDSDQIRDSNWAGKLAAGWEDNFWEFKGEYLDIGENFENDMGFTLRKGIRTVRTSYAIKPRPRRNRFIREVNPHGTYAYTIGRDNRLLTRRMHSATWIFFQDGGRYEMYLNSFWERLDQPFQIRRNIAIPPGDYSFYEWVNQYFSDRSKALSGSVSYRRGPFWDGTKRTWNLDIQYRPDATWTVLAELDRDSVKLAGGAFDIHLVRARVSYAFNTRIFLDAFFQYNTDLGRLSSNIRFRFIHRPLSDLFLVYKEVRDVRSHLDTDRIFTVKFTRLFSF